eukprot:15453953-Alexandrium_andersonii.AAC.1
MIPRIGALLRAAVAGARVMVYNAAIRAKPSGRVVARACRGMACAVLLRVMLVLTWHPFSMQVSGCGIAEDGRMLLASHASDAERR